MRPIYETSEDRHAEALIMRDVQREHGIGIRRIRKMFPVDYAVMQGPYVTKWVEIKARNYSLEELNEGGGLYLSALKVANIYALEQATGILTCVVAGLTDGIYVADVPRPEIAPLSIVFGGRVDRDDPADVEPCVCIPAHAWRKIGDYQGFKFLGVRGV